MRGVDSGCVSCAVTLCVDESSDDWLVTCDFMSVCWFIPPRGGFPLHCFLKTYCGTKGDSTAALPRERIPERQRSFFKAVGADTFNKNCLVPRIVSKGSQKAGPEWGLAEHITIHVVARGITATSEIM